MSTSSWQPHIVVAAVVEREGRYLMVEELIDGELRINQPAGHWEADETLVQGVVRETLEESAWQVQPTGFLGTYVWQPDTLPYAFVRFAFVAQALTHEPERQLDAGILRARWMSLDELLGCRELHRGPAVLQSVEDHRAGRILPLDVVRHLL